MKPSFKGTLALIVGIALALFVVAGCGGDDDATGGTETSSPTSSNGGAESLGSVKMGFYPAFGTLALYIAVNNGFFEEQGLEVEAIEGTDTAAQVAAVGKQFDIVMATPAFVINAAIEGIPIEVVSGQQLTGPEYVNSPLVSKEPVKSIKEMEGETVGVLSVNGTTHNAIKYMLEEEGVNPDDVRFEEVPPPNVADQVEAGRAFAAYSVTPFYTATEEETDLWVGENDPLAEAVTIYTKGAQTETPSSLMIVGGGYAEENPEIARAFRAGLHEAQEFIRNESDKARAIGQEWLGLPQNIAENAPLPGLTVDTNSEELDPWVAILSQVGALTGEVPDTESLYWSGSDEGA